jgi:predicted O-methyltransferase YrrM
MEYKFTKDWFSEAEKIWPLFIPLLPARKAFLEIGSFEGRSMVWTAENMVEHGGFIDCIDTWEGGEEHVAAGEDMGSVEELFDHNRMLVETKKRVEVNKYKGTSVQHLAHWLIENPEDHPTYDFIYIDGSHKAKDVLTDACMAWHLLKPEGVLVFDDYLWGDPRDALHRPKIAIDAFTNIFGEELSIVYAGHQLAVRKNP